MKSLLFVLPALVSPACFGAMIGGPTLNPNNGHTYYALSADTWTNSETQAQALGGHLATIRSQSENDFVFNTFGNLGGQPRDMWIGLYDPTGIVSYDGAGRGSSHDNNFVWVSGEPVSFKNWGGQDSLGDPAEPNNWFQGTEYWGMMFGPGQRSSFWNDARVAGDGSTSNDRLIGIVELVPEPSTVVLLLVGAISALLHKKRKLLLDNTR
jgi:hypothetical protein